MNYASLLSLKDSRHYRYFSERLKSLDASPIGTEKDRQALRFGIVQQLVMLGLDGPSEHVRQSSIQWLSDLSDPSKWGGDQEVMEGLLDGLACIAVHSQVDETSKKQARTALESLERLANSREVGLSDYLHVHAAKRQQPLTRNLHKK